MHGRDAIRLVCGPKKAAQLLTPRENLPRVLVPGLEYTSKCALLVICQFADSRETARRHTQAVMRDTMVTFVPP